jgi:hypothetical protein
VAGETPDYRRLNVQSVAFPVTDLGELAVRLGALQRFDRRGDMVYATSFEDAGASWAKSSTGGGYLTASLRVARTGIFSMLSQLGPAANDVNVLAQTFQVPLLGKIGLEATMNHLVATGNTFDLGIDYYNGTRITRFLQRYRLNTGDVQVLKADNTFVTVLNVGSVTGFLGAWRSQKMVVDLATLRYERTLFGAHDVDVSAYSGRDIGATALTSIDVRIVGTDEGASAFQVQVIDDIILTQAEPANGG